MKSRTKKTKVTEGIPAAKRLGSTAGVAWMASAIKRQFQTLENQAGS